MLKIKILKKKIKQMRGDIILLYIHVYHKWRTYDIWFWNIRCGRQKLLSFWVIFCSFSPLTNQKIRILKLKKTPGDITISQISTRNDNHMMYGSWDMECDRQNFLSFWNTFCPFTPLWIQKIKILKKWKKHLEILSFYTSLP